MATPNIFEATNFIRQIREDPNLDVFSKIRKVRDFLEARNEQAKEDYEQEKVIKEDLKF